MIRKTVFLTVLFLTGCSLEREAFLQKTTVSDCMTIEDRAKLADFIIKCAEAANPKSDEEGEDLVEQCETTGRNVVCPDRQYCRVVTKDAGFMEHYNHGILEECSDAKARLDEIRRSK